MQVFEVFDLECKGHSGVKVKFNMSVLQVLKIRPMLKFSDGNRRGNDNLTMAITRFF